MDFSTASTSSTGRHFRRPAGGVYSRDNRVFLLPDEAVRLASDPDAALMQFPQTRYTAAADRGGWDRAAVETDPAG